MQAGGRARGAGSGPGKGNLQTLLMRIVQSRRNQPNRVETKASAETQLRCIVCGSNVRSCFPFNESFGPTVLRWAAPGLAGMWILSTSPPAIGLELLWECHCNVGGLAAPGLARGGPAKGGSSHS